MTRGYTTIDLGASSLQIHYQREGQGKPLILLHPSPLSSGFLKPQLGTLAASFDCYAIDTPGYGNSDALPSQYDEDQTLVPYVEALAAFIHAAEFESPLLYGSATGAQIAIEYAIRHPDRCGGLLLENVAIFTDEECDQLLPHYFPDLTPTDDGQHLGRLWDMASLSTHVFPWFSDDGTEQRKPAPAPPGVIQAMVKDYLSAGDGWSRAYRAAFANERPERLKALTVNTRIVLWQDGLLGRWGHRINELTLPANVTVLHAGAGLPERLATLHNAALTL